MECNSDMASLLGVNIQDLNEILNRLKAYRIRTELRKNNVDNWSTIEETMDILDFITGKLKSDTDCVTELLMIKGMWNSLTSLLADELNDNTVINVLSSIAIDLKFYKTRCMVSNVAKNSNSVSKNASSVSNNAKGSKHKLDSDDEDVNAKANEFITVKSNKNKKLKDSKNVNKTPVIETSNIYAALENVMDTDETEINTVVNNPQEINVNNVQSARKKRIDPFWVQKSKDYEWRNIVKIINEQLKTELPLMDSGKFVKIYPQDAEQFRVVQSILISKEVKCFAISPQGTKPFKIIIKGIPSEIPIEEVKDELIRLGYDVVKVAQLRRYSDKSPLPIFQVHLAQNDYNKQIYSVKKFFNFIVVVEAYKFRGVKQCYNCLHFNHSSELCTLDPKCLKCAGNHRTNTCSKNFDEKPKCANCNGEHPANFKGCPMHPLAIKARNKELKIIKDLGKGDLTAVTTTSDEINILPTNINGVKSFAQVARKNTNKELSNNAPTNVSIDDENFAVCDNESNVYNNISNANITKINDVSNNDLSNSIDQLIKLEKILSNICALCEKLDNSETAKALGVTNLLANQLGSIPKNIH